jgi:hypothetical protein
MILLDAVVEAIDASDPSEDLLDGVNIFESRRRLGLGRLTVLMDDRANVLALQSRDDLVGAPAVHDLR